MKSIGKCSLQQEFGQNQKLQRSQNILEIPKKETNWELSSMFVTLVAAVRGAHSRPLEFVLVLRIR